MDIRVLGPMDVLRNGEWLALSGPRQRTLLALTVDRLPKPVDTDTLTDELWGEGASRLDDLHRTGPGVVVEP